MRIKELREKRMLSQCQLASMLEIRQTALSRYESGEREADYATLIRLADYFDVSVDYLLGRTENPQINR